MNKTLFLHIGVHKTGTTAIQSFFSINREKLKEHGILYPGSQDNHYSITVELRETDKPWLDQESQTYRIFSDIKNNLHKYQKFVLSSEGFCENDIVILPRLFKAFEYFNLGITIKIVVFYRPQHTWLESVYQQLVKGMKTRIKMTFACLVKNRINFSVGDYFLLINRWSGYFGQENIILVRFCEKQKTRKIFSEFRTILNLPDNILLEEPTRERSNIGLETISIEFLRWLNIFHIDDSTFNNAFKALSSRMKPHTGNYNLLTTELFKDIFHYFDESNKQVALKYLYKKNETLFEDFQHAESYTCINTFIQLNHFKPDLFINQIKLIKEFNINILFDIFKQLYHFNSSDSEYNKNKMSFLTLLEENISSQDIDRLKQTQISNLHNESEIISEFENSKLILKISASDFLQKVFCLSKDIENGIELEKNKITITSKGNDPHFSVRQSMGNYDCITIVRIRMTLMNNTVLKIYYQTRSDPKYNEIKTIRKEIKEGTNNNYIVIDHHDYNGQFRIDPGEISGVYVIHEIIVKSNTKNHEKLSSEFQRLTNSNN